MTGSNAPSNPAGKASERELVITRIFDAPREMVWRAWTEPEHMVKWWGPRNFTTPVCKVDFRVGGKYLYCMRSSEGQEYWGTGVYNEIIPLEKIVFTDSFADEQGNIVSASHYGIPEGWPKQLSVIVTFEEQDGKTKMTLRHVGVPEGEMGDAAEAGWNESFDKLAEGLK